MVFSNTKTSHNDHVTFELVTYFRLHFHSKKSTGNVRSEMSVKSFFSKPSKSLELDKDNPVIILGGTLTSETDLSNLNLDCLNFNAPANLKTKN